MQISRLSKHPEASVVAVDVGGTFVRAGSAVLSTGDVSSGAQIGTDALRENDPIEVLVALIGGEMARLARQPVGVVIGVPGFMDGTQRSIVETPNVRSLRGVALADRLESKLGLPVWLEHDAALLTRGEYAKGSARHCETVLAVYFGTGVGAAFLHYGRPLPMGPFRMQLGHIPVRGEGRICACGGMDCVEPYASGPVLIDLAARHGTSIDQLFEASVANGALATAVAQFLSDQAIAVATAITLLDPGVVVIGGGIPTMRGYPFDALQQEIRRRLSPVRERARPRIALAELGTAAVLHGAANLVAQHLDDPNPVETSKSEVNNR